MTSLTASVNGQFVKSLHAPEGAVIYGFHQAFGLISEENLEKRLKAIKRKKSFGKDRDWIYRFKLVRQNNKHSIEPIHGCEVNRENEEWLVKSRGLTWRIGSSANVTVAAMEHDKEKSDRILFGLLALAFVLALAVLMRKPDVVVEKVEELPVEPITVVMKPQKTITLPPLPKALGQALGNVAGSGKTMRAVRDNLGFLGLIGQKDIKNAVGGAQVNLNGSAGAGKGGKEGSGGEVLTGLGRGVRATSVGNSGVQGLGGIGTKGAGGGKGGYGNVAIASGEGVGISTIAAGKGGGVGNGVGIDGGLDRYVIQATIAKYLNQVRACYEDRLRVNPGLSGTLAMDFEIAATGKLNFAKVKSSSVGDELVGGCVAKRMMDWEFPKPRGGVNVSVSYPFALRPVSI